MIFPHHSDDKDLPVVSVIIVFHNEERFLEEAIASIRAQDFDAYELLLVDDGSTDLSPAIARTNAQADPGRITLLSFADGRSHGISAARNLGLTSARGRYIAFLDGDDVWEQGKLREQVEILESDAEIGMVYGRTLIWYSWNGNTDEEDFLYELGLPLDRPVAPFEALATMVENKAQSPTTCNAMFRRDLAMAQGGSESAFRGMFEDQVLFAKIMAHSAVQVSGRIWARYRQHSESECATVSPLELGRARMAFLKWLRAYLSGVAGVPKPLKAELDSQIGRERRSLLRTTIKRMLKGQ